MQEVEGSLIKHSDILPSSTDPFAEILPSYVVQGSNALQDRGDLAQDSLSICAGYVHAQLEE